MDADHLHELQLGGNDYQGILIMLKKQVDRFIRSNSINHCCNIMNEYATQKNSLIDYDTYTRRYSFLVNSPNGTHQFIKFCPWCGLLLPKVLDEEWINLLKEKYNLENPFKDWDRVPNEFKTDEWWKKRGL